MLGQCSTVVRIPSLYRKCLTLLPPLPTQATLLGQIKVSVAHSTSHQTYARDTLGPSCCTSGESI